MGVWDTRHLTRSSRTNVYHRLSEQGHEPGNRTGERIQRSVENGGCRRAVDPPLSSDRICEGRCLSHGEGVRETGRYDSPWNLEGVMNVPSPSPHLRERIGVRAYRCILIFPHLKSSC